MPLETPNELAGARADIARLAARREHVIATTDDRRRIRRDLLGIDADLGALVDGLRNRVDPCDASPEVPLVLLPVRVETKLVAGTTTLRVRITPDEVHIDSLVRAVGDDERTAGAAYWATLWGDAESASAWPDLVTEVGARRAPWVAHVTTPTNLDALGDGEPAFPEAPAEVTHGTVARCLPDQFVVRVFPRDNAPITVTGAPIARDVPISPIALGDDELTAVAGIHVPAGSEWTVDFPAAKAAGLGVEVTLPAGTNIVDRIVVVGTRRSVSEADNAADLMDLLMSHRFSDGASLLAAGTPTNNAETARSPYRDSAAAGPPNLHTTPPSTDASKLAAALGIDAAELARILDDGPPSPLQAAEAAANTALWFATWEPVLARLDDAGIPGVTPASIESARRLHRDHVRGAGPAPVLRIGAQPYGVLPVTELGRWQPRSGDLTAPLVPLITRTLARWVSQSRVVPRVRPGGELGDDELLEMLGASPVATGVRARPAVDGPKLSAFAAATGADAAQVTAERRLRQAMLAQYSVDAAKRLLAPALHDESRTIALPIVSERDAEVVAEILAGRTPKVDSVLQALLEIALDEANRSLVRAAPQQYVNPLLELLELDDDVSILVRKAAAADGGGDDDDPERYFEAAAKVSAVRHFDGQPDEPLSLSAIEPVAEARTSLAQVAVGLGITSEAKWVGANAAAEILKRFAVRGEVRAAMTALAAAPLAERRIAVAHALDLASHRIDAWATALADSRRATLAARNPTGATIGAFGYVEEIRLGAQRREPDGWIHAPSSTHAVTAGVLASAHRSNIGAEVGRHPFAIDLSSRRGVAMRRMLEGAQAGQAIGALLGYQIERALAGTSAARFQLTLREIAPMSTDELGHELGEGAENTRIRARVAAADVVDGATLLHLHPIESLAGQNPPLRQRLSARPNNAFVAQWEPVSPEEWAIVAEAMRAAAATLDAVSDALLSESVLQYATGNASRASAAMDAMSSGAAIDPELSVLGVRQSGRLLTHGLFAAIPDGAAGWSSTRPRAVAEPRLEAWAARRLGDPADIVVTDAAGSRHTLDEAGWAALDLVFTDDLASLERELRASIPSLGDTPLAMSRDDDWPVNTQPLLRVATLAATLRTLIAGASPVTPDALVRTGERPERTIDVDELLDRAEALLDRLDDALDAGADAIAAVDPATLAVEEDEVAGVVDAVRGLAAFGVPLEPDPAIPPNVAWAWGAWHAASVRLEAGRRTLQSARAPRDPAWTTPELVDAAQSIAEGVLGDGFLMLPLLVPADADAFAQAVTAPAFGPPPRAKVHAFVRDHAAVRAGVGRLAEAQLLGSALGRAVPLTVVQLTERDGATPAAGTDRWLAGPLPDDVPWPATTATHLVVEIVGSGGGALAVAFAGLAFDGWTETLPFQPDPRAFDPAAPENPLRAARATTGLAVHANQASARAPQVLLSAISPDGMRWTTDAVVETVLEAVDLARARLVTLEHAPGDAAVLPAIYVKSPWLQASKGLVFAELADVDWKLAGIPFLSEVD
ncbi:hypothetical protein [Agromyces albus]|uniref:hypothetical protein n=1 Tax=Agromyces albus TaxID=205332 RepID=UPI002785DEA3|nr:hypothetical protein [Agromyces albus]MDQ0576726.1 hypothetical protein [Agromyces albus]